MPNRRRAVQPQANANGRAHQNGSPGAVHGGLSHRPLETVPGPRVAAAGRLRPASEGLAKPELETGSPSGPVPVVTVKIARVGPAMSGPPTTGLQLVSASSSLKSGPQESLPRGKPDPSPRRRPSVDRSRATRGLRFRRASTISPHRGESALPAAAVRQLLKREAVVYRLPYPRIGGRGCSSSTIRKLSSL
jgi:hypothetical protein